MSFCQKNTFFLQKSDNFKNIYFLPKKERNAIILVLPLKEINIQPELSIPPRFRIHGWYPECDKQTNEGQTNGRKSLYLMLDGHFPALNTQLHQTFPFMFMSLQHKCTVKRVNIP